MSMRQTAILDFKSTYDKKRKTSDVDLVLSRSEVSQKDNVFFDSFHQEMILYENLKLLEESYMQIEIDDNKSHGTTIFQKQKRLCKKSIKIILLGYWLNIVKTIKDFWIITSLVPGA